MTWWVLELILVGMLIVIVLMLGPFIERFGRSYGADLLRAYPRTGKSSMVLVGHHYSLAFTTTPTGQEVSDTDDLAIAARADRRDPDQIGNPKRPRRTTMRRTRSCSPSCCSP